MTAKKRKKVTKAKLRREIECLKFELEVLHMAYTGMRRQIGGAFAAIRSNPNVLDYFESEYPVDGGEP